MKTNLTGVVSSDEAPNSGTATDDLTVTAVASLGLTKNSTTASVTAVGQVVPYTYVITNTGSITLNNVTLTDDNTDSTPVCTPAQPATLAPGAIANCTAQHTVTLAEAINLGGDLTNIATANSDQTGPVQETLDIPIIRIFDPPLGIKVYDDSGLPVLLWTMVWINDSNDPALDAEVRDPIPGGTTYVTGSINCNEEGSSVSLFCDYDNLTEEIVWRGTIGPDLGATDADSAANEIVITFQVTVEDGVNSVENTATIDADQNGNDVIDPVIEEIEVAFAQAEWTRPTLPELPETGFAPDILTNIPDQETDLAYQELGDVWLEIPSLGIKTSIVGVPVVEDNWDVTWLDQQAGWLTGTAFPSYSGNSLVTAHVYLPSGLPGPFVDLQQMEWDEHIIVHAFGQQYIYQVRSNQLIAADNQRAVRHEEFPWLTLITCKGYNENTNSYNYRVIVRAVLIEVKTDLHH